MVVAALCGPIYSVATALVTGLLMSITSPTNLVYIGNYLAVGLFSGLFAYWGFYKNVWKSCIAGAVVGLFCGVAGSTVTVAVMGGYSASIRGIITAFLAQTFSLSIPVANMLSEISTDILDKIPSAIITHLLVFRIPNKFLPETALWQQIHLGRQERRSENRAGEIRKPSALWGRPCAFFGRPAPSGGNRV